MSTIAESTISMDLNADLGEGFGIWTLGDDEALLKVVTSANVACGFHAGDPSIMRRICAQAAERSVVLGAHVSYRDLAGFGRRRIDVPREVLTDDVVYQIAALDGVARVAGTRVSYVKPHGALNNTAAVDEQHASAIVDAVMLYGRELTLLVPPGSELERQALRAGLTTVPEAFPDRAYSADGALVPRSEPGAVIHDGEVIAQRALQIVRHRTIRSIGGTDIPIVARSLCLHGDNPGALAHARFVRRTLIEAGYTLAAFA